MPQVIDHTALEAVAGFAGFTPADPIMRMFGPPPEFDGPEGQWKFAFPNGFGADAFRHAGSYGGEDGLFELAVLHDGEITYDTPITQDVIGHLDVPEVLALLGEIAAL